MRSDNDSVNKRWLALVGPTGSGKSALAMLVAQALDGEIINCDSVQVYRGFDLGSAKPSAAEQARIPHHLLDVVDWNVGFDAAVFAASARRAVAEVQSRGRLPVVVGGTGLYLRALLGQGFHADLPSDAALRADLGRESTPALYARLEQLDPTRASELHPNDRFRIVRSLELVILLGKPLRAAGLTAGRERDATAYLVVLNPERAALHQRIATRAEAMLAAGLVAEVRALLESGVDPGCKPMQSIGYAQVVAALQGRLPWAELPAAIAAATRQYAKRQDTWFRKLDADLRWDPERQAPDDLVRRISAVWGGGLAGEIKGT